MMMQKSLFAEEPSISDNLIIGTQKPLIDNKFIPNLADAFGVTKTGLRKGDYGILENIFYGIYNLRIPLEMLIIQNPAEILAQYYTTGNLKRKKPFTSIETLNIPRNFLDLVKYINNHAYKNGKFASLSHEFAEYFDPKEQRERLRPLEQIRGDDPNKSVGKEFVDSFSSEYKYSNADNPYNYEFYDPNWEEDARDKGKYADKIYEELEKLKN